MTAAEPLRLLPRRALPARTREWVLDANCAATDPEAFFPPDGSAAAYERARRVCWACTVRVVCLSDGLAWEAGLDRAGRHGMVGGLTPAQRARINGPRVDPADEDDARAAVLAEQDRLHAEREAQRLEKQNAAARAETLAIHQPRTGRRRAARPAREQWRAAS